MRSFTRRFFQAAVGAITIAGMGLGAAAAADIPPLQGPPPQAPGNYGGPPQYYGYPPADEGYPYPPPPPAAYAYPPPPAYYYAPPPVAVVPGPYYARRYYDGGWGYGRYRGYLNRGYHRW
jgi:hypothetical protein